jgi:hypothetical protein
MPLLVKQYISRSKPMSKVVVTMGWNCEYVMDADKALTMLELLKDAELFKDIYRSADKGGTTYHIFPQEKEICTMKVLSSNFYNLAKLAGKPEEK